MKTVRQVLEDTKSEILARGWTQGMEIDSDGCVCVSGALTIASGYVVRSDGFTYWIDEPDDFMEFDFLISGAEEYLRRATLFVSPKDTPEWRGFVGYNDDPGRTKEEVLALIDLAIKLYDEEHAK